MINTKPILLQISASVLTACLVSCGAVNQAGRSTMSALNEGKQAAGKTLSSLAQNSPIDALLPASVPVVEVREKDLKKMKTGEERALAYINSRDRRAMKEPSWFSGPAVFQEVPLPSDLGAEADDILLPPKNF